MKLKFLKYIFLKLSGQANPNPSKKHTEVVHLRKSELSYHYSLRNQQELSSFHNHIF